MFELFIASRYIKSKRRINFITIISFLSTFGITIGTAALIIVLSVFNGFGSLVREILISFDPHVKVFVIDESGYEQTKYTQQLLTETKEIKSFYPYVEGKVIAVNSKSYEIVTLKGISESMKDAEWGLQDKIISGKFDLFDGKSNKVVLGLPIALRLSARVGDTINITSANSIERLVTSFSIPTTRRFIVAGIFESNNRDYDVSYIFTSLPPAQTLFGLRNKISGFDIRLNHIDQSDKIKEELTTKLEEKGLKVYSWYDLHRDLYTVMQIERWGAYLLLSLIIAVATFNILGSLNMTVIEKKKDIGVLRSMGINQKTIKKIFMFEGMLTGFIGSVIGISIGLLICWLQMEYNFYPLDPTKYIIDAMPVEINISDIIMVGFATFALSYLAALYPSMKAAKTNIIESIKYE
ncbi:MAG: ABC transporter permease [Melioribacteraceae bacterium]|nr:ABC transporter permease [Melioribacteraceae bacterium]